MDKLDVKVWSPCWIILWSILGIGQKKEGEKGNLRTGGRQIIKEYYIFKKLSQAEKLSFTWKLNDEKKNQGE